MKQWVYGCEASRQGVVISNKAVGSRGKERKAGGAGGKLMIY